MNKVTLVLFQESRVKSTDGTKKYREPTFGYNQNLNCWGNAGVRVLPSRISVTPSKFSVPPSKFSVLPYRFERWLVDQTKKGLSARINTTKFGENSPKCGEEIFFALHSISGTQKHNFLLSAFAFPMRLVKAIKASPHAKFYSLSSGYNNHQPLQL